MRNKELDRIVKLALLAAISLILVFAFKFPVFPAVAFLEYDFADVPILIGTFLFGPAAGLALAAVVSVLQAVLVSAASGWIGALMHFVSTGAMVLAAGLVYKRLHTLRGAILALLLGAFTMTALMVPLNLLLTPLYFGGSYAAAQKTVWGFMPYILAFNAIKAFAGVFGILAIVIKYLSLILEMVFRRQTYLVESVEKIQK